MVAAAFDHWDSRAGDPQLHTHVVVMNRAQARQRREVADAGLPRRCSRLPSRCRSCTTGCCPTTSPDLGYGWEPLTRRHSPVPKWEIAGVPEALHRGVLPTVRGDRRPQEQLIDEFVATHGRQPTSPGDPPVAAAGHAARPDRTSTSHPLAELVAGWRTRAASLLAGDPEAWVATLAGPQRPAAAAPSSDLTTEMLADVGQVARRTRWPQAGHVHPGQRPRRGAAAAARGPVRHARRPDRRRRTHHRLRPGRRLLITPPDLAHTPALFRRADGTSRFRPRDPRSTPPRSCSTPKHAARRRPVLWPARRRPDTSPTVAAGADLPGRRPAAVGRAGRSRSSRSPPPAGWSTCWSGRPAPGSPPPWPAYAPPGNASTAPGRWSGSPRPPPPPRCSPTSSASDREHRQMAHREHPQHRPPHPDRRRCARELHRARPLRRTRRAAPAARSPPRRGRQVALRAGSAGHRRRSVLAGTLALDTLVAQASDGRREGRCWSATGHSCRPSKPAVRSRCSSATATAATVPELSEVRRFTPRVGTAPHPSTCASGDPTVVDAYQGHDRIDGGDRDDHARPAVRRLADRHRRRADGR